MNFLDLRDNSCRVFVPVKKFFFIAWVSVFFAGCATTNSIFVPYPQQVNHKLALLKNGQEVPDASIPKFGANQLLNQLEEGRLQQIEGDVEASIQHYQHAIQLFQEQQRQALIYVSQVGESGAAVVVNDNVRTYQGDLFERTFLHLFQAQNFLFQYNLEAAGVEVRRMNLVDKAQLAATRKKREKALEKSKDLPFDYGTGSEALNARQQALNEQAAKIKETYFNAYAYFVSGLIYELSGYGNDAYIDYKKSLELAPNNLAVQNSVIRLGTALGFNDDLGFSEDEINQAEYGNNNPEVIVMYEEGLVPVKQEFSLPIYKFDGGVLVVSIPGYFSFDGYVSTLNIEVLGSGLEKTQIITDVQPIVAKALKDDQVGILIRQALRVAAKNRIQNKAEQEGGTFGGIVASLYNIISERADLRSWNSLPQNAQVARFFIPEGEHQILLSSGGAETFIQTGDQVAEAGAGDHQLNLNANAGDKIILRVIRVGDQFYVTQAHYRN